MTPAVSARILVVEDIASLAMTYAAHLEGVGHTVDVADSGKAARALIDSATTPYDVVLLDLQLPDCDGLDWLAAQPELASRSSVIVITSDGIDQARDRRHAARHL